MPFGIPYVFVCFVFVCFFSLNPRPLVQLFFDMHTPRQLRAISLQLSMSFIFSLEVSLFLIIMYHYCAVSFFYGEYVVRFPFDLFLSTSFVSTGWILTSDSNM